MNTLPSFGIVDFEVHLLMTMRLRIKMSKKESLLKTRLAEHGLSTEDAQRIDKRVSESLDDERHFFQSLKSIVNCSDRDTTSLEFASVFWPGFTFKASADQTGRLISARYWRTSRNFFHPKLPTEIALWSMDVSEFSEQFGPTTAGRKWSLFDPLLPGYEELEFQWSGENYGAGFSWGLFMFAAMSWD